MSRDPAFLFYPGDYLRDTQCLSEKSQVAYDRIMCEHMRNICISQKQLDFFTKRLSPDELEELKMVLTTHGKNYAITWIVESITKRRAYSESRRNNRLKTEVTHDKDMKTYDKHMDNANENVIKDTKTKHGEYKHVLLTKEQHLDLSRKFGTDKTVKLIKELDEGIEVKGYKYKNHYLAILKWEKNYKAKDFKNKAVGVKENKTLKDVEQWRRDAETKNPKVKSLIKKVVGEK